MTDTAKMRELADALDRWWTRPPQANDLLRSAADELDRLRPDLAATNAALETECHARHLVTEERDAALAELAEIDAAIAEESQVDPHRGLSRAATIREMGRRWKEASDEVEQARHQVEGMGAALSRLGTWTHEHGAALCPTAGSADTFGDGMREAKRQVGRMLADAVRKPATRGTPEEAERIRALDRADERDRERAVIEAAKAWRECDELHLPAPHGPGTSCPLLDALADAVDALEDGRKLEAKT